jgi:hypothetical protein
VTVRTAFLVLVALGAAACGADTSPQAAADIKAETRVFRARLEIARWRSELERYHTLNGAWPQDWDELGRRAMDPWGAEYAFSVEDDRVAVYSLGPDGEPETGDEVFAPAD